MALLQTETLDTKQYAAAILRYQWQQAPAQAGVVNVGDYLVSQRAAGANMSVDIAAGGAWVQGGSVARQGLYHQPNDATVNQTVGPADATNPRIDQVILAVNDSSVIGNSDIAQLLVVAGAPTAGATLPNRSGANPLTAYPSYLLLAYVLVPPGSTSVVNANIGGFYDPRRPTLGAVAGAPPQYATAATSTAYGAWGANPSSGITIQNNADSEVGMVASAAIDDPDNMFALGQNAARMGVRRPGLYLVQGNFGIAGNAGGTQRKCSVRVNGVDTSASLNLPPPSAQGMGLNASGLIRLGYGDQVALDVYQDSGVALNIANPRLAVAWQRF